MYLVPVINQENYQKKKKNHIGLAYAYAKHNLESGGKGRCTTVTLPCFSVWNKVLIKLVLPYNHVKPQLIV